MLSKYLYKAFLSIFLLYTLNACSSENAADLSALSGKGGSLARFTIKGDYLYVVDNSSLHIFDISQSTNIQAKNTTHLGFGIETIYPYQNNIFIGAETGMHILDATNPLTPKIISTYQHVRSCDPVVVQGNYAYVTLRRGNTCGGGLNVLDVVDVSDLKNPLRVKSHAMYNPHGLGIDGNSLFVCDGDEGLKFFDAQNPLNLIQTKHLKHLQAYDVIPLNGLLLMIGEDGFYQYNYNGDLLSSIPVVK